MYSHQRGCNAKYKNCLELNLKLLKKLATKYTSDVNVIKIERKVSVSNLITSCYEYLLIYLRYLQFLDLQNEYIQMI